MPNERTRRNSNSSIKKSVEKATLWVTIASTIVAVAAAGAAFWSGYEARKTRLDNERPFLSIDPQNRDGNDPIQGPLTPARLRASDKSPALNVRVKCTTTTDGDGNAEATWHQSEASPPTFTFPYILPKQWVLISCPADPSFHPVLNDTIVELGTAEYQDDRKKNYLTPFCFIYKWTAVDPNRLLDIAECNDSRKLPDLK